jgi:hypothetical protein
MFENFENFDFFPAGEKVVCVQLFMSLSKVGAKVRKIMISCIVISDFFSLITNHYLHVL